MATGPIAPSRWSLFSPRNRTHCNALFDNICRAWLRSDRTSGGSASRSYPACRCNACRCTHSHNCRGVLGMPLVCSSNRLQFRGSSLCFPLVDCVLCSSLFILSSTCHDKSTAIGSFYKIIRKNYFQIILQLSVFTIDARLALWYNRRGPLIFECISLPNTPILPILPYPPIPPHRG